MPNMVNLAISACMAIGMALPVTAQVVHPEEQVSLYTQVKDWTVYSITHNYSGFAGCRATKIENGSQLALELYNNLWQIVVPTDQASVFGGAILSVDKMDFDSQFGFINGFATKELTQTEIKHIKSGNQIGVEIIGDFPRYWSLRGSTAAILKVQECNANGGRVQTTQAPAAPPVSQPQTAAGNCDSPTTGPYQCTVTMLAPGPGYQAALQVDSTAGSLPAYFFKVRPNQDADAWVSFDNANWLFIGVWEGFRQDSDCAYPKASQEAEAWNNLGQDAWELCIR